MLNKTLLLLLSISALFAGMLVVESVKGSVESKSYFNLTLLSYEASQPLEGFINLGLSSEKADNLVSASINGFEQSIPLLEFLENAKANFTCQPTNCLSYYEAGGGIAEPVLMPGVGLIGFKISEEGVTKIEQLRFDITNIEDFQETCGEAPIIIDLLDDGTIDWQYLESGNYCGNFSTSECYSEGSTEFNIGPKGYCQKKFLQVTSRLKLGAMVRKKETGGGNLEMYIYDPDTRHNSGDCNLPEPDSSEFSLQNCELNFTIRKAKDYYICIIEEGGDGLSYSIRGEELHPRCGYAGKPEEGKEAMADFELYAQIAAIIPFDKTVTFNENEFKNVSESFSEINATLLEYVNDYLLERYDRDCSSECIIPIKAEVKNRTKILSPILDIRYDDFGKLIEPFYSLEKKPALINMDSTKLNLNVLNLTAPEQYGAYKILLKVGSFVLNPTSGINFSVVAVPQIQSVFPLSAFAGFETIFSVTASSPVGNKIVSYSWNFGDGTKETTANVTAKHKYLKIGSYNLTVRAEDEKGAVGKATFIIEVEAPKEAVGVMLVKKRLDLDQLSVQLEAMPEWLQEIVKESYNLDELSIGLKKCEEDFKKVTKDEAYVVIKEQLDRLLIPSKLEDSITIEEMPSLLRIDSINPEYVKRLGGGSFESSLLSETKNAMAFWQSENLDIRISGLVKTARVDSKDDDIFTLLHLDIIPKKPLGRFYFVFVLPPHVSSDEVKFAEKYKEYSKGKLDKALGFRFSELTATKRIDLALPGKQDFLLLNMFASPNLDELEIVELTACGNTLCEPKLGENYKNCPEDCRPTKKVITYILLILLSSGVGIFLIWRFYAAIYDLMQQKKLFKAKKDYIDMLIFISSAAKKGQTEEEITKKLVKAGWNKEQIEYVMLKAMKARKKIRKEQEKKST